MKALDRLDEKNQATRRNDETRVNDRGAEHISYNARPDIVYALLQRPACAVAAPFTIAVETAR